jgi:TetR/AcrR family transcriptional regulator
MHFSREYPEASRVFANEVLHGAPEIGPFLSGTLRRLVAAKSRVMRRWIAAGRMADLDPMHLFFSIWATTQTYADFATQIAAVSGSRDGLQDEKAFESATRSVETLFLRATGLEAAPTQAAPPSTR